MRPGAASEAARLLRLPDRRLRRREVFEHLGCPELDCVRDLLPGTTLSWAAQRAERLGVGADRALISAGWLTEEAYIRALARSLNIAFEPLEKTRRAHCWLSDGEMTARAASGLLPISDTEGTAMVMAPRGTGARGLIHLIQNDPACAARFRLTTAQRLNAFLLRASGGAFSRQATESLKRRWPALSAATRRRFSAPLTGVAASFVATAVVAPSFVQPVCELTLAAIFLAWLGLRLIGARMGPPRLPPAPDPPDRALPVYSVIAAVYREAASVGALLGAIERFDYPAEKLDVIIAVEADDAETRAALKAAKTRLAVSIIEVPPGGPRTKPKALNVALPFARGTFSVIYDAEDRPDPGQLRRALQAFRTGSRNLACVQAQLCIDNTADGWLAHYFTAEYAAQFDVFLPGLARLGIPLPLGGSSNHFHTATLRKVGAWDPYNVTEDADLGMRLARWGFRASVIDSTTYEEAPARPAAWLRQRTRWFKGWLQTWLVHMRKPRRLWRELGPAGFVAFNLMVGGTALAALVHPFFVAALIYAITYETLWAGSSLSLTPMGLSLQIPVGALYGIAALCGYLTSAYLGWLGLSRRGLPSSAWVLLLTPVHWMMLSTAAWRAIYQLFTTPFTWEKTEHGLARTSRRTRRLAGALTALERDLRHKQQAGTLSTVNETAKDTSSDRRQPRRVSA